MIAPFRKVQILLFPARAGGKLPVSIDALVSDQGFAEGFKGILLVCVELFFLSFCFPSFFGSTYITNEVGGRFPEKQKTSQKVTKAPFLTILLHWIGRKETNP